MDTIRTTDELTIAHMCAAAGIPAPGGAETARARWLAERLRELDLTPVADEAGNVWALSPAADGVAPRVVVAAHLDTVFPADTPLAPERDGERLTGPGIADNARGLAGMIALARTLRVAGWPNRAPVVFLGTVGEEGAGDLRGAKHYLAEHGARTAAFIALDGAGSRRIIVSAVGSRRLRATFRGAGGHSWSDWGAPHAIHAAGRAIAGCAGLTPPVQPRTTLSVGRMGGGTAINVIPAGAWLEIDLRSEAAAPLSELEARVRQMLADACAEENAGREASAALECDVVVFGDRPAGRTPADHPLVLSAIAATRALGVAPELASSSTDANVAMAAGIPAIAIGAGGEAGGTHTVDEWYDNRGGPEGLERALRVVLDAAG